VVARIEREQQALGQRVKRLRERAGLTQEALAEHAGVHAKHVQRIEGGQGNPQLATLVAISKALATTVGRLFGVGWGDSDRGGRA